jgi:hypothetical protein
MGDAGEGLVDAESRLAERMEEREEEKKRARQAGKGTDPERVRQVESLKLARVEMQRQLELATHKARQQQLTQAVAEIDKRIKQLSS